MTITPERQHRRRARGPLPVIALVLAVAASPASAVAAPSLTWSAPAPVLSGHTPTGVSCASEALCVAVDGQGAVSSTTEPTATNPHWVLGAEDSGQTLNAVSCAAGGPCVAVDGDGKALVSATGASAWKSTSIDGTTSLTGISCPSASLCVAVDRAGDVLTSTSPSSGVWSGASSIDPGNRLTAVACSPSPLVCVAIDSAGNVLSSSTPSDGGWRAQRADREELTGVSCAAGICVAVDGAGDALASEDPGSSPATWSLTPLSGTLLTGVSCAASGLCVAVGDGGETRASDDAATSTPAWSAVTPDAAALTGVSCLSGGLCLAVDASGHSLAARVHAPEATTVRPTEVTDAGATLAGVVNPNDAVLGTCSFEFGTSTAYTQSLPCSVLPVSNGGAQSVSATVSGLAPNTTYHYRVVASSPAGTTVGADEAFTTAVSTLVAIVHPNPSISGTPANGQTLSCHPGTPAGTTAQLTYAWLRDLIPIAGASASAYTVKGQDTGHHLQCQVTATDGGGSATAKSAFVTIPVGGVPLSAGETAIGKAAFKRGKLVVPISCSSEASGGCQVALRLSAVETLSGGRIVAVAARSSRGARAAAGVRHLTVTLASVRLRVARGAHFTLSAALDATGRRLLASERHFGASLSVSGTVIGVIEAQLGKQLVTLSSSSHATSTHAARRR